MNGGGIGNISSDYNGMFFGFVISTVLIGITIVQGWIYLHENRDTWGLRSLVILLILLDIVETCCSTQIVHHYLIKHFGDMTVLSSSTNMVAADCTIIFLIKFLVHLFFTSRLSLLSRSRWVPGFVLLLSIATLILGLSIVPLHTEHNYVRDPGVPAKMRITAFHSLAAVTDITVTIALSHVFSTSHTSYPSTKTLLYWLLVYSLSRGILVAMLQVGHIIMYLFRPGDLPFWISLHFCMCKMYVITTVFILNSRFLLRETSSDLSPNSIHLTVAMTSIQHVTDGAGDRYSEFGNKPRNARSISLGD